MGLQAVSGGPGGPWIVRSASEGPRTLSWVESGQVDTAK